MHEDLDVHEMLRTRLGYQYLLEHTKSELCEENVLCWAVCMSAWSFEAVNVSVCIYACLSERVSEWIERGRERGQGERERLKQTKIRHVCLQILVEHFMCDCVWLIGCVLFCVWLGADWCVIAIGVWLLCDWFVWLICYACKWTYKQELISTTTHPFFQSINCTCHTVYRLKY